MYTGTDQHGNTITPTSIVPTSMYYEIPVVFVVDARTGPAEDEYGSEADAAQMVVDILETAGINNGSTEGLDCWTLPANQDVTGADNRSGTIVYGSDCEFLARLCDEFVAVRMLQTTRLSGDEDVQRAERLRGYLSRYTFDGA